MHVKKDGEYIYIHIHIFKLNYFCRAAKFLLVAILHPLDVEETFLKVSYRYIK